MKRRFPALVIPPSDDLCYATKNRQDAVRAIAPNVEMFLVVTSDYSSNGMRLLELAQDLTGNARRIESVADLRLEWFEGVRSLGVTSAASTPDDLVQEIVAYFQRAEMCSYGSSKRASGKTSSFVNRSGFAPAPLDVTMLDLAILNGAVDALNGIVEPRRVTGRLLKPEAVEPHNVVTHPLSVAPMMDWTDRHSPRFHARRHPADAALHRNGDDERGAPRRPGAGSGVF